MKNKKSLIEAALFVSENPLSVKKLSKISGIESSKEITGILDEIKKDFDSRGIHLILTPEGYQFQVRDEFLDAVANLTPYSDLTSGALRSLSLIAFRQPITQSQLVKIQGNKAYNYIKRLEKKGLVNSDRAGRTKILKTTKEFEKYFGKSLDEIKEKLSITVEDTEEEN